VKQCNLRLDCYSSESEAGIQRGGPAIQRHPPTSARRRRRDNYAYNNGRERRRSPCHSCHCLQYCLLCRRRAVDDAAVVMPIPALTVAIALAAIATTMVTIDAAFVVAVEAPLPQSQVCYCRRRHCDVWGVCYCSHGMFGRLAIVLPPIVVPPSLLPAPLKLLLVLFRLCHHFLSSNHLQEASSTAQQSSYRRPALRHHSRLLPASAAYTLSPFLPARGAVSSLPDRLEADHRRPI
jgi:hypothetical protein